MVILAQNGLERYICQNPLNRHTGYRRRIRRDLSALTNGSTDIANSSRPIKTFSAENKSKDNTNTWRWDSMCGDGISIYLNKSNPVEELTLKQIADIYSGKITNWKQSRWSRCWSLNYTVVKAFGTFYF